MTKMISFLAAGASWLAPLDRVVGVRSADDVHPLPDMDSSVAGVIDHDGTTHPVLRSLVPAGRHVLLIDAGADVVGVLVDEAVGVTDLDPSELRPPPAGQRRGYVEATVGAGAELMFVLDPSGLLVGEIPTEEMVR